MVVSQLKAGVETRAGALLTGDRGSGKTAWARAAYAELAPDFERTAWITGTAPEGWCGAAAAIAGADFTLTTPTLRLPTLVIAGANDGTTPPDLVRETAEMIPGARFQLMRATGHLPMVERPAPFAEALMGFLREIGHL